MAQATIYAEDPAEQAARFAADGFTWLHVVDLDGAFAGKPANADTVTVAPSAQTNVFKVMDDAIRSIDNAPGNHKVTQAVTLALAQIDSSLERLLAARSQAGDWLNRADTITSTQEARTLSLEADRSKAEDLDVAKGISDFNKLQTGYQAALQSYAQIQKLSLFNFIN